MERYKGVYTFDPLEKGEDVFKNINANYRTFSRKLLGLPTSHPIGHVLTSINIEGSDWDGTNLASTGLYFQDIEPPRVDPEDDTSHRIDFKLTHIAFFETTSNSQRVYLTCELHTDTIKCKVFTNVAQDYRMLLLQ